jgi:thiamine biosynthesis protein ThiI
MSSGIDSPVATYLFAKKVENIVFVHCDNDQYGDKNDKKIFLNLLDFFKEKTFFKNVKTYLLNHGISINEFKNNCNNRFTCIFCKRMFLRYAEKIAAEENAQAIITGDSLGQVASQTIQNINTIEQSVKIPVLRPLIGYDKQEIIQIARNIGTYDISISPSEGCKAVPNKPCTRAKIEDIIEEENKINVNELIINVLKNKVIID